MRETDEKNVAVARAIFTGMVALQEKYKLPEDESCEVFKAAYASSMMKSIAEITDF